MPFMKWVEQGGSWVTDPEVGQPERSKIRGYILLWFDMNGIKWSEPQRIWNHLLSLLDPAIGSHALPVRIFRSQEQDGAVVWVSHPSFESMEPGCMVFTMILRKREVSGPKPLTVSSYDRAEHHRHSARTPTSLPECSMMGVVRFSSQGIVGARWTMTRTMTLVNKLRENGIDVNQSSAYGWMSYSGRKD